MEEKKKSEWFKDSDSLANGQEEKAIPSRGGRSPPGQNGTDQAFSTKKPRLAGPDQLLYPLTIF